VVVTRPTGRFEALDSLRGICALLVALFHLKSAGLVAGLPFIRNSWLFVDFFFVLSGFVIAASYGDRLRSGFPVGRFMALRLGRVYPLHVFVLAVFALFELFKFALGATALTQKLPWQSPNSPLELFESLGLLQIFGFQDFLVWNGPSWSIAAEVWTYLTMALVLAFTGTKSRVIVPLIAIASLFVLALLGEPYLDRTFSFALLRCLYGFALGMMTFAAHRRIASRPQGASGSLVELVTVAAVVSFVSLVPSENPVNLAAPFVFVGAVLVFAGEAGIISRVLTRPFPLLLGALSYSIYMVHVFVEARAIDVLLVLSGKTGMPLASVTTSTEGETAKILGSSDAPWLGDAMSVAVLAAIVVTSWFTYRFVETPCREYVRRRVAQGTRPPLPAETPAAF